MIKKIALLAGALLVFIGILRHHRLTPPPPTSNKSYDYSKEVCLLKDVKGKSVKYVISLFKNVPSADCRVVDQWEVQGGGELETGWVVLYSPYLGGTPEPIRSKSDGWIRSQINHLSPDHQVSHVTKVQQGENGELLVKFMVKMHPR